MTTPDFVACLLLMELMHLGIFALAAVVVCSIWPRVTERIQHDEDDGSRSRQRTYTGAAPPPFPEAAQRGLRH